VWLSRDQHSGDDAGLFLGCRGAFEGIGVLARAGHAIALEAVKAPLKEAVQ